MSSKRALRRRSCERKVRYKSKKDAKRAIYRTNKRKGWAGHVQAYMCQFCGGWHFGHPPKRKRSRW